MQFPPVSAPFTSRYSGGSIRRDARKKLYRTQVYKNVGTHGIEHIVYRRGLKERNVNGYVMENGRSTYLYKLPRGFSVRELQDIARTPIGGALMRVVEMVDDDENLYMKNQPVIQGQAAMNPTSTAEVSPNMDFAQRRAPTSIPVSTATSSDPTLPSYRTDYSLPSYRPPSTTSAPSTPSTATSTERTVSSQSGAQSGFVTPDQASDQADADDDNDIYQAVANVLIPLPEPEQQIPQFEESPGLNDLVDEIVTRIQQRLPSTSAARSQFNPEIANQSRKIILRVLQQMPSSEQTREALNTTVDRVIPAVTALLRAAGVTGTALASLAYQISATIINYAWRNSGSIASWIGALTRTLATGAAYGANVAYTAASNRLNRPQRPARIQTEMRQVDAPAPELVPVSRRRRTTRRNADQQIADQNAEMRVRRNSDELNPARSTRSQVNRRGRRL